MTTKTGQGSRIGLGIATPSALAHAFLVATEPAQDARLERAPSTVRLHFSEPPERGDSQVTLRRADGGAVHSGEITSRDGGRELRVPTPGLGEGVYVVSWRALSAIDGHGSSGEFAFALGDPSAAIPAASQEGGSLGWGDVAATWAFVLGFALAAGAAGVRFLAGAPGSLTRRLVRAGVGTG